MKNLILGIVIVVIIGLGIGGYIFIQTTSSTNSLSTITSTTNSNSHSAPKSSSTTITTKLSNNTTNSSKPSNNAQNLSNSTSSISNSNATNVSSSTPQTDKISNNDTITKVTKETVANNSATNIPNNSRNTKQISTSTLNLSQNTPNIINTYNLSGAWQTTNIAAYPLVSNGIQPNLVNQKIIIEPNIFKFGTQTINNPVYKKITQSTDYFWGTSGYKGNLLQNNYEMNILNVQEKENSKNNCNYTIIFENNKIQILEDRYVYNAIRI